MHEGSYARPARRCPAVGSQWQRSRPRRCTGLLLGLLLACAAPAIADAGVPVQAPLGVAAEHLDPAFWIGRLDDADHVRLDAAAIARLNRSLRLQDPSIHRLEAYAEPLPAATVRARIEAISASLPENRYGRDGQPLAADQRAALRASLGLDALIEPVTPRFGLVVRRAPLRGYPTRLRLFSQPDDRDIDRLQESALFPGDAVVALHSSTDDRWMFVVSERYAAWIETAAVALGKREDVLGFAHREPSLTVLGHRVQSVASPNTAALSRLDLDMGVRLPWRADWPPTQPVNGQLPLAHWVVEVPQRGGDGSLLIRPALVARSEQVAAAPLPFTAAHLIRQSFAFLGERYGWGHDLGTRDCSGFVSEVYRSLGIVLPRNTGDQARSPAFDTLLLDTDLSTPGRERALAAAQVGDLIHVPGHVMLLIGRINGEPWMIHDAHRIHILSSDGQPTALPVNGVVVTPLHGLLDSHGRPLSEVVTHIQRIRPAAVR